MEYQKMIILIMAIIIGLCVGSFLNVVIYRLPNGMNLAKPSSHCPKCNSKIKWYDNIPVLSYIILGGKCRNCKEKISFRYTIVEIMNSAIWALCVCVFYEKNIYYMFMMMILSSTLICIAFIDLENMIIPDSLQIIVFLCAIFSLFFEWNIDNTWQSKVLSCIILGGAFFLLFYIFEKVIKKEVIGGGDIKLIISSSLLLGFANGILSLAIACILASIVIVIIKAVKKYGNGKEYPFAPYLCLGIFIACTFGKEIIDAYMSLF